MHTDTYFLSLTEILNICWIVKKSLPKQIFEHAKHIDYIKTRILISDSSELFSLTVLFIEPEKKEFYRKSSDYFDDSISNLSSQLGYRSSGLHRDSRSGKILITFTLADLEWHVSVTREAEFSEHQNLTSFLYERSDYTLHRILSSLVSFQLKVSSFGLLPKEECKEGFLLKDLQYVLNVVRMAYPKVQYSSMQGLLDSNLEIADFALTLKNGSEQSYIILPRHKSFTIFNKGQMFKKPYINLESFLQECLELFA